MWVADYDILCVKRIINFVIPLFDSKDTVNEICISALSYDRNHASAILGDVIA